jgi:predicted kinase
VSEAVLGARLLIAFGPPYSGKGVLAEHLNDAGLVHYVIDQDDLRTEVAGDPGDLSHEPEALSLCAEIVEQRMLINERTLLVYSFVDATSLGGLLEIASRFDELTCLIIMDSDVDVALRRHREQPRYRLSENQIVGLYSTMQQIDPNSLGFTFVVGSVLAIAVEGQDDW